MINEETNKRMYSVYLDRDIVNKFDETLGHQSRSSAVQELMENSLKN